jgi:glycosyltransferase involved in cell wall biosynthesis
MTCISVIMPVYNGERFIEEALESMIHQSREDWELIIVDDGSTDSTYDRAATIRDPRIKIIRQTNQGEAGARNTGLSAAQGTYYSFLDADDCYRPNALTDLACYLDTHPQHDVVYSDGYICDSGMRPLMQLTEIRSGIHIGDVLENVVLSSSVITVPCCTMVRGSALRSLGVRFDTRLIIGADWRFWIELARSVQFGYMDKITCLYRIHGGNITLAIKRRERRAQLAGCRLKIMNSSWFGGLSTQTRFKFLYVLLIDYLKDAEEQQLAVLNSDAVGQLSRRDRAALWRGVGGNYLTRRADRDFALLCLQKACDAYPADLKSKCLLAIARQAPPWAASMALSAWRIKTQFTQRIRSLGRRRPRAVPASLNPAEE